MDKTRKTDIKHPNSFSSNSSDIEITNAAQVENVENAGHPAAVRHLSQLSAQVLEGLVPTIRKRPESSSLLGESGDQSIKRPRHQEQQERLQERAEKVAAGLGSNTRLKEDLIQNHLTTFQNASKKEHRLAKAVQDVQALIQTEDQSEFNYLLDAMNQQDSMNHWENPSRAERLGQFRDKLKELNEFLSNSQARPSPQEYTAYEGLYHTAYDPDIPELRRIWLSWHGIPENDTLQKQLEQVRTPICGERSITRLDKIRAYTQEKYKTHTSTKDIELANNEHNIKYIDLLQQLPIEQALTIYQEMYRQAEVPLTVLEEANYDLERIIEDLEHGDEPLHSAEQTLIQKGYLPIDPYPDRLPRAVKLRALESAEPLTGKEYQYDTSKRQEDDLKELKAFTSALLERELVNQALKEIEKQLNESWTHDFQAEPADLRLVLQWIQRTLEAGSSDPIKVKNSKGDTVELALETQWPKLSDKIDNLGIAIQFEREKNGTDRYENKDGTKTIVVTPEPIAFWEMTTGMQWYRDPSKNANNILDANSISKVFKGTTSSVPIIDRSGNEVKRLYNLNCKAMQQSGYDEITGDMSIYLAYRPPMNQYQSSSQMILVADFDTGKIYLTDRQQDLNNHLKLPNSMLHKIRLNSSVLPKYKDRFRYYLIGEAGWHFTKQGIESHNSESSQR